MVVGNPKSTSNSKSVSEKIDERILRLLGLEDVFDLDYETYITLLKEILVKSVVTGKNKLAAEEVDLLKEELKRVKGKRNVGRFKVKEKKVSVSGIKGINITNKNYILNQSNNIISPQKLLPSAEASVTAAEVTDKSKTLGDEFENNISAIRKSVESIANILGEQLKFQLKSRENERKDSESRRRGARESALEKPLKVMQKVIQSLLAPVKSIWESILNFFIQTLLGKVAFELIGWFANPENAKKIRSLIRFFGDWWPALLGAYILFGTSFGKFTSSILGIVGSGLLRLTKFAIPQLLKFIKSPLGIATGLFTAGATIPMLFPETVDEQERKVSQAPGSNAEKIKELQKQKDALSWFEKLQGKGSEIDEQISRLKTGETKSYGFSGGGWSGLVAGEKGTDKIPAMLTDGEFVMSAGAVHKYGIDTLESMNAAGGGNNKPREISGTVYASGGGYVGFDGEGVGSSSSSILNNIVSWFKSQGIDITNSGNVLRSTYNQGRQFVDSGLNQAGKEFNRVKSVLGKEYNSLLNDPRVKEGIQYATQQYNRAGQFVSGLQKKAIDAGFLNKDGKFEGAARAQATNFLSDMLPNLPGVSAVNKMRSESYLSNIGLGRDSTKFDKGGANFATAFYGGSSGLDRAHNIGQMQVNKMSDDSRQYYLAKIKQGLASGSLKSGDIINAYDLPSNSPIRREQGSVRFYVSPDGKPYLLDTYGFDPGKVNLGSAQKDYDEQVKKFQNTNTLLGKAAKFLNLKPMADATEGGSMVQFGLALRNKLFGYDPLKEAMLGDQSKRFKNKLQIEELSGYGLGDLKALGNTPLTAEQKKAVEAAKAKKLKDMQNAKKLEAKRPWWDKMGWFGGASARMKDEQKAKQEWLKKNPGATLYNPNDPRRKNTGQAQQSRFSRPKNAGVKPVNPPKPKVTVVRAPAGGGMNGGRSSRSGGRTTTPPSIQAQSSRRTSNSRATHGIK
jgi:hypothetical protein